MPATASSPATPFTTPAGPIRRLTAADAPALLPLQAVCYGAQYMEDAAVFAQRLASPLHCSLGVELPGPAGLPVQLAAYAAAYWSAAGQVTALNGTFPTAPANDPAAVPVLYLHDMAVLPRWAGQGVARALLNALWAQARARGLTQAALVSVQGSQTYWERQGFTAHTVADTQQRQHLLSYGNDAVYMVAAL